ncbi:amidohydrolase [Sulfurifustis variabilis]|uniref:Amidohydrolase n=1 Tax=Sulfurifustis variabilis TaxID=1675686 RepID=A0A1B4V4U5_9GAMM|nr:amidohydrolase family protein [Sulfurifustis variabilis]BAU48563.1 amidohydrolase [Sulfurifustis variabilis]
MNNAFVVDADSHILEPIDLWENYLEDKSLLPLAPRFFNDENGDQQLSMEGELLSKKGFGLGGRNVNKKWDRSLGKQRWEEQEPGGFDPHIRIKDMDAAGVDAGLVFPTIGLRYSGFKDAVLGAACCRAHNKWMADFARPYPDRLFPIAALPFQEPALALKELEFAVEKLGFRGAMIRPNPVGGRNLDHPDFYPIWERAQDLGCVIAVHEGGNMRNAPQVGRDRFQNWAYLHAVSHSMEMQMAVMCVTFGGVLDRYPRLRFSFVEAGGGWLPFWLERLDSHARRLDWLLPECKTLPSEAFRRQCVIQVESDESTIPMIADLVGEDYIVWGTDYPHFDCNWNGAVEELRSAKLSRATADKILGGNLIRFYDLPVGRTRAAAVG